MLSKHLEDVHLAAHTTTARVVENTKLYELAEDLVSQFRPSKTYSKNDIRWTHFYLPLEGPKLRAIPFGIGYVNGEYWLGFDELGQVGIKKGDQKVSDVYFDILRSTAAFEHLTDKAALEKVIPWKFRTGKAKRKYVDTDVDFWKGSDCRKVSKAYASHLAKGLKSGPISLNHYLETAAIAYRAAFPDEAGKSPLELYKAHADLRHGGMLEIKRPDSRSAYNRWLLSDEWQGSHPFEVVFSWHNYGIHFAPPRMDRWSDANSFNITVGDSVYSQMYIKMLSALMQAGVAVTTQQPMLNDALQYLSGELYYTVNDYSNNYTHYEGYAEEEELFKHIKWDEIKVLKRRG